MIKKINFSSRNNQWGLVALLATLLIGISTVTRIILFIQSFSSIDFTMLTIPGIFFVGLFYDVVNAFYYCAPLVLYLWLLPSKFYQGKYHLLVLQCLFFIYCFLLLFNAVAEWLFWDEFSARFNFIAVDYLVYTTEVIGNIRQSYPIEWILVLLSLLSFTALYFIRPSIKRNLVHSLSFKQRTKGMVAYLTITLVMFFAVTSKWHYFSTNAYVNELSGNGLYELFAAYRNNELDYQQFYKKNEHDKAFQAIHSLLKTNDAVFETDDLTSIARKITGKGEEKKLNLVMISVESFSADFMGSFGNTKNITPFLDSLASHSLLFTNLYATGTRTVRGLEALSLCIPPTPGQSIVRRPGNEHLFSLGKVFDAKGYESKYIYGGYGYFDNMSYFFDNNGYKVVDRDALQDSEIDYENIWGVADENLFTLSLREVDKTLALGKPSFVHIMTTSNHRPFTYPDGRIDIPSHTSREGAVKYTDYSIGKFIKEAKAKAWFNNTLFVIVADHCASSAGKTELPVNKYHIPMLIYSPANVAPGKMDRLMSQIDIGPTLLGMLNFSYTSKFFGYDMATLEAGRERAFISTYQKLGFIKGNNLVVLSPQSKVESFQVLNENELVKIKPDDALINEAIAWYQSSSYCFKHGLLK